MADEQYELALPDGTTVSGPNHEHVLTMAEWYVSTADDSATGWGRAFESGE